jgi:hypothetical protein
MAYLHIDNLYKNQEILLFKECYALEKIHGTSANFSWNGTLNFHSGGESHTRFVTLFNAETITAKLLDLGFKDRKVTVYGEAYGGKQQGMSHTYGNELKFVAFDVLLDEHNWLSVPEAAEFCKGLSIEFVHFTKVSTNLEDLDAQRDADSEQAIRNGVGAGKKREGVVLRPLIELSRSTGERIITKHKRDEFRETASPRVVDDPVKLRVLEDANKIAVEWVTVHRLEHVLSKIPDHGMEKIPVIIAAMVEDVTREGAGEIVDNDATRKAIKAKTVTMYKDYLKSKLKSK